MYTQRYICDYWYKCPYFIDHQYWPICGAGMVWYSCDTLNDPSKIACKSCCVPGRGTEAETFCIPYFGGSLFYCCTLFKCLWTRVSSKSLQHKWKKCVWKFSTHTCVTVYALVPICVCIRMCMYIYVPVCVSKSFSTCSPMSLPSRQGDMRIEPSASPPLARSPNSQ